MAESADINARDARTAAELSADVDRQQLGDIYAQALLGASEKEGVTADVLADFDALLDEILTPNTRLEEIFASVLVSSDEKTAMLDRLLAGRVAPTLLVFLKVVARHGRLDCLRAIHRQAHVLDDKLRQRIPVRLTTATPISDVLAAELVEQLRKVVGGQPILQRQVDPDLIGGAVLYVGDTVYDGSLANQLHKIRQKMIDRSVHEIQSRRDRFRHTAGN
jgi:F-type H+-transporting ATPase subunit delta